MAVTLRALAALRLSVVAVVILGATGRAAYANEDCDMRPPEGWTIGTLAFRNVKQPDYKVLSQTVRNTDVYCNFRYTGGTALFELTNGMAGEVKGLSIAGEHSKPGSSKNWIHIGVGGLSFGLTLSRPIRIRLLGGSVVVPKGAFIQVSNSGPISMDGSKLSGALKFQALDIAWHGASISLPLQLPRVRFTSASDGPIEFRTEIRAATTEIFSGAFSSARLDAANVNVASDAYRIRMRAITSSAIRSRIAAGRIKLTAQDLDVRGALVVKPTAALGLPVVADGRMRVQSLNAELKASTTEEEIDRFDIVELRYAPTAPAKPGYYTADDVALAKGLSVPSLDDEQEAATAEGLAALRAAGTFNFYAFVPVNDFAKPLRQALEHTGLFSSVNDVALRSQQVLVTAMTTSGLPREEAIIKITPSIVDKTLLLRASMDLVEPSATEITRTSSDALLSGAAAKINETLGAFEGAHIEWPVPLDLPVVRSPKLTEHWDIEGHGGVDADASDVTLITSLLNAVMLIDPSGIRILARIALQ